MVESLPDAPVDRTKLIMANRAVCEAMATHGRAAATAAGAGYPATLASAVDRHHRAAFGN